MKRIFVLLVVAAIAFPAAAQVVASTSWVAAFAYTAGADDVTLLAPYEMTHPPEYVLRPSDIVALREARVVIYAGYESMVDRLLEATSSQSAVVQITTVHSYPAIEASVLAIARALGTESVARSNLAAIRSFLDDWREELVAAGAPGWQTAVHFHQQALAQELGLSIGAVFGPAPMQAREIDEVSRLEPMLIIDNVHNPLAMPLSETTDAVIVEWRNFPGSESMRTVLDVLRSNREALRDALAGSAQ